jgi:hypothetical protein
LYLAELQAKLDRAGQNLALAENEEQYRIVARFIEDLSRQREKLQIDVAESRVGRNVKTDLEAEVAKAMELACGLTALANDRNNYAALGRHLQG